MISAFVGKPGKGKTLAMTVAAIIFWTQRKRIYTNYDVYLPNSKQPISELIISRQDLENAKFGMVFLDEAPKWLDSRTSFSSDNSFATGVLQTGRKRGNNLGYSAQNLWMCDIRLRENTDYIFEPEVFYMINGHETHIKQNFFYPISVEPLLPYAWLRLRQFDGWVYQNVKYLYPKDVIGMYEFPMAPFVGCYNTSEEINPLLRCGLEVGMEDETDQAKICENHFKPNEPAIVNPDSGRGMDDTYDFEFTANDELYIVDSMTPEKGEYLNFKDKLPLDHYYETADNRSAKVYIGFYYPYEKLGQMWMLPVEALKGNTSPSGSCNIKKILKYCIKLERLPEPEFVSNQNLNLQPVEKVVECVSKLPDPEVKRPEFKDLRLKFNDLYGF